MKKILWGGSPGKWTSTVPKQQYCWLYFNVIGKWVGFVDYQVPNTVNDVESMFHWVDDQYPTSLHGITYPDGEPVTTIYCPNNWESIRYTYNGLVHEQPYQTSDFWRIDHPYLQKLPIPSHFGIDYKGRVPQDFKVDYMQGQKMPTPQNLAITYTHPKNETPQDLHVVYSAPKAGTPFAYIDYYGYTNYSIKNCEGRFGETITDLEIEFTDKYNIVNGEHKFGTEGFISGSYTINQGSFIKNGARFDITSITWHDLPDGGKLLTLMPSFTQIRTSNNNDTKSFVRISTPTLVPTDLTVDYAVRAQHVRFVYDTIDATCDTLLSDTTLQMLPYKPDYEVNEVASMFFDAGHPSGYNVPFDAAFTYQGKLIENFGNALAGARFVIRLYADDGSTIDLGAFDAIGFGLK